MKKQTKNVKKLKERKSVSLKQHEYDTWVHSKHQSFDYDYYVDYADY